MTDYIEHLKNENLTMRKKIHSLLKKNKRLQKDAKNRIKKIGEECESLNLSVVETVEKINSELARQLIWCEKIQPPARIINKDSE